MSEYPNYPATHEFDALIGSIVPTFLSEPIMKISWKGKLSHQALFTWRGKWKRNFLLWLVILSYTIASVRQVALGWMIILNTSRLQRKMQRISAFSMKCSTEQETWKEIFHTSFLALEGHEIFCFSWDLLFISCYIPLLLSENMSCVYDK